MLHKNLILTLLLLGTTSSSNVFAQHTSTSNSRVVPIENFEDFEYNEEAFENAVEMGLLKRTLEIREPSKTEMLVRKLAASLLMKYLALKNYLNQSSHVLKNLWQKLCLMFIRPSTN